MMNMMLSTSFFGQLKNIILIGVIAVIVIFIIMLLSKSEAGKKILLYVGCFLMITVGVFSGIQLYKEVKAESYVNGSINISNEFSKESFSYYSTSCVFYHYLYDDTDTYSFEIDLLKVDFNGKDGNYQLWLNDYLLINADFKSGSVFSAVYMDFYNTEGELVHATELQISIQFLSSKTTLKLVTVGKTNASYLEQYFADNGIRLKVEKIL